MTIVEEEILSTPAILRQVQVRVTQERAAIMPLLQGPLTFLGCGSSYCLGLVGAVLYESAGLGPAQALMASEYLQRPGWSHLAISRTGQTSELVDAMGRARQVGAPVSLICGAPDAPAARVAQNTLLLEFAPEQSVIQTRFISAAALTLRLLLTNDTVQQTLAALPDRLEEALSAFDAEPLSRFEQLIFLGRGWRHGLALSAGLNLQETALMAPNGFQTLEYRHGPLACADPTTLVWCFDPPEDSLSAAVLDDVRRTGATVRCTADDPLIALAQAQLLAVRYAARRGIDPDAPRNLQRAVVFSAP